jgi:hypothetical protein
MTNNSGTHHTYRKLKRKGKNLKKMSKSEKRAFFTRQNRGNKWHTKG